MTLEGDVFSEPLMVINFEIKNEHFLMEKNFF